MTTALRPRLHSDQHRHLTASAAAPFTGLFLAPNIGIIQLDQPLKGVTGVPVLHGFANLMTPAPSRRIADAQIILELTGRGARGSGGHQKDGPKPVSERLSGLVKDGIGDHRGLMITTLALIFSARSDQIGLMMVTARTSKTIGPFALDEIPEAIPLGAKSSFELSGVHGDIHGWPPLYDS